MSSARDLRQHESLQLASQLEALAGDIRSGRLSVKAAQRIQDAIQAARVCDLRDSALRRAAELLVPTDEPHRRAEALSLAVGRFRERSWWRIQAGTRQPEDEIEEALVRAFRCPMPVPESVRHLYRILVC